MLRKLFPCALTVCFAVCLCATAAAQKSRSATSTIDADGSPRLQTDLAVPSAVEERPRVVGSNNVSSKSSPNINITGRGNQLLLTAIQERLGSSYHYGGTGPETFDCSGFVWRTFAEAGFNFTRGPARSYWATMPAATKEEQGKFGTLVFFSGLAHVGIVADEHGFYHASRHHGVIYSPFNEYWLARVDGFRRVPVTEPKPVGAEKTSTSKAAQRPAATTAVSGGAH